MNKLSLNSRKGHYKTVILMIFVLSLLHNSQAVAQHKTSFESSFSKPKCSVMTRKFSGCELTNVGFGGAVLKLSQFKNQLAFMTGGRGAATLNKRYTIGGGGYGIFNNIRIKSISPDTSRYFKMGYGGPEIGYIFYSKKSLTVAITTLAGIGAAFTTKKPKSENESLFGNEFKFITVFEPSISGEIALTSFTKLHLGISYRHVNGSDPTYMKIHEMNGFSCSMGLLFGK
jgi:hypothetical protein